MIQCTLCGKQFDDADFVDHFEGRTYFDVECDCGATLEIEAEFALLRVRPPADESST